MEHAINIGHVSVKRKSWFESMVDICEPEAIGGCLVKSRQK